MIIDNVKINQEIKNNNGIVVGIMEGTRSSATCVGKKQISWLHLSDLHLGHDSYNESVIIETL